MARTATAKIVNEVFKIVPCKFAFDPSDPYCANCNGMEIEMDGQDAKLPATECGAYSPSDGVDAQPVPETTNTIENNADSADENGGTVGEVAQDDTIAPEPTIVAPQPSVKVTTQSTPIPKQPKPPVTPKVIAEQPVIVEVSNDIAMGNPGDVLEIQAESGVSFMIKDKFGNERWYKFAYTEKRSVDPYTDIEEQRRALWNDVNGVVDTQVEETVAMINEQQ